MRNRKFFVCVCLFTMNIIGLSACGDPGSSPPDSHSFLSADSDGVSYLGQIATSTSSELQNQGHPDEEMVYTRVTVSSFVGDPNAVTVETGAMDDMIHQRVARPWTHQDESEPYVYRNAGGTEKREDGTIVQTEQVFRRPNLSPHRETYLSEPPFVDEKLLRDLAAVDDPEALVRVHLKPRHVPRYDKPLRARAAASPAESLQVEAAREQWEADRESRIRRFLEPVLQELETLDATNLQVLGTNGWVSADLPMASLELLLEDERFSAVVSSEQPGRNTGCDATCNDRSSSLAGMSNEWYLGDGHELSRLGSLKFLQQNYNGSLAYNLGFGTNYLIAGIAEYGKYEDDGLFDNVSSTSWRIMEKKRVHSNWVETLSNLDDQEGLLCENITDGALRDEYGCHGTGVAAIAIGNYVKSMVELNSNDLGDSCFSGPGNAHCDAFYEKTRGMAPLAKGIFYWLDEGIVPGYQEAISDNVDVLNLSHEEDANRCDIMAQSTFLDELENAFDEGVFLVNATGNFDDSFYEAGFRRDETRNDCLINSRSTRPKVFSVGGIIPRAYVYSVLDFEYTDSYGNEQSIDAWQLTNTTSTYSSDSHLHPIDSDDYRNFRMDADSSQTGGAYLAIKNESGVSTPYTRAMTGVDLLAPVGGWLTTTADGTAGEVTHFFHGSSGAAPHVSGLAILIKHWLLATTQFWIENPGELHTIMLLMGDRSVFSESTLKMYNRTQSGDKMYGFGRVRLRLLGHSESELSAMSRFSDTFANDAAFPSIGYKGYDRLYSTPAPATTTFVKVVMMQVEDMDGKSSDDMVSDFQMDLYITNGTYTSSCPTAFLTACGTPDSNGNTPNCTRRSDTSHDVKKMVAYEALTGSQFSGKCFYVRLKKRHITPQGVTVKFAHYRSQVPDWASSSGHTCAIRSEGLFSKYAYCWGNNDQGQLGDGTTNYRFSPVQISGTWIPINISAGGGHTCMVNSLQSKAFCWGRNDHGQLGINSLSNVKTPQNTGLTMVQSISAGSLHTCAVRTDNSLWCWGSNRYGQLGTGDVSDKLVPTQIAAGSSFSSVSAGKHHTCALAQNQKIYCWGLNDRGQSGSASGAVVLTPQQIDPTRDYIQISSGSVHACGVSTNNTVFCWGDNRFGQFGQGTAGGFYHVPTLIPSFNNVINVHAGGTNNCARITDGTVWCWGDNRYGQLGDFSITNHYAPQQVSSLGSASIGLSVGKNAHACALRNDAVLLCWGQGDNGQLGTGSVWHYLNYPSPINTLANVASVSCGN